MVFLIAAVAKNLRRIASAPWSVAIWVGVPLLVGGLLSAVMGGSEGGTPKVHLLIADQDGSFLSGALVDVLASDQLAELLMLESVSAESGTEILDAGNASAMLVIPTGFQTAFLASEPQSLTLVVNPLQSILPEMAEELARLIADFGSYAQMALAPELAAIGDIVDGIQEESLDQDEAASAISALSGEAATTLFRVLPVLSTAVVEIDVATTEGAREASFTMLFFPGLLMMSVIFAAQGLAEDLWQEREMGTLRRLKSTTASLVAFFAARIVTSAIALGIIVLPLSLIAFAMLALPVESLPLTVLWLTVAGLMLAGLASLIQVLAPTRKAGALFSTLVFFPLLLVGGSFFPLESMPDFLAAFGRLTPNGMMLEPLKAYLIGTGGLSGFGPPLLIAVLAILVMTGVTAWRVTTSFSTR
ncbi:MAG: ABC transporter permease [Hyphomicrobiales bacterium]|nr:ABC transporter permease [Hyphomicrobiales bacterium]